MTVTRATGLQMGLFAVLAACGLAGCGGAKARFTSHLQRGQAFLASGSLDKAGVEFRNATQIEPKNAQALYFNGRVAEARSNIREAYGYYRAAIDADAGYAAARAAAGKMLVFAGGAKDALDLVAPGLSAHPDDADLLAVRAAARQQLKENDAARADAERAVRLAPTNENALAILAAVDAEAKEYSRAISLTSAAVGRAPRSAGLREVLTNLYLLNGEPDKAEEQMRKVIELKPMEIPPRSQLALHLTRIHNLDGAQQVLEESVRAFSQGNEPSKADTAKLLLVDFVSRERSREQGEKTLRDFIAREPDNDDLRLGLGALLQRTGAAAEALAAYQEVVKRDGTGAKGLVARNRMAAIHLALGHSDAAGKLVAEVLQKNPRDDDALIMRATLAMQQKDPTSAVGDLRAVLRDQPNSVPLQRTLAAAYLAKGESALAEETLRAAMQVAPNDPAIWIDLSQLLARTDRAAQSVALLEESVTRFPESVAVHEALVRAYLAAGNGAIGTLQTKLEQDPKNLELLNLLGDLYFARKDYRQAITMFSRARTQDPLQWQTYRNLARAKLASNDPEGAIGEYQAALKLAPAEPQLVAEVSQVYEKQGRIDDAIAGYESLYKGNPQVAQFAANNLAMLLVTYRTDPASLDRARDLTTGFTTSDRGTLLDTVGWVHFKRGEYQEALSILERAAEHAPESRVIRYHLAMTQLQLGLRDRARRNLESVLNGPNNFQGMDEARTALDRLKARA